MMFKSLIVLAGLILLPVLTSSQNGPERETVSVGSQAVDAPRKSTIDGEVEYYFPFYFYLNPSDPTDRLIIARTNRGWMIRFLGENHKTDVFVDGKEADENDPSIKLYMQDGPIRFYLPTNTREDLSQANWQHESCHYQKIDDSYELVTNVERVWTLLIQSRCSDHPATAARYLYREGSGLISIILGELKVEGGKEVFHQDKMYFLDTETVGFGLSK